MSFEGNTVIVTGGGQGIGRAIAQSFASAGAGVVIADIDEEAGLENLGIIEDNQGKATFIRTDVAEEASVRQMIEKTVQWSGGISILINNAGLSIRGNIFKQTMDEWDRIIGVNLRGPYLCSKYAAPYLIKTAGSAIINIASTRALMSEADSEAYAASKGGLLALTHALAISLGPHVRVNSICPGWIEVNDWKKTSRAKKPHHSEADRSQHPVGRVGCPDDIAKACLYLASPEAGFITGANLVIDGGMTVKMIYCE